MRTIRKEMMLVSQEFHERMTKNRYQGKLISIKYSMLHKVFESSHMFQIFIHLFSV